MAVEHTIPQRANTCVLLAPQAVDVGKHVTDAVRAGGWTLARTEHPIDAMVVLCTLEQDRRSDAHRPAAKHMLLIHQDVDGAEISALTAAVRKHLPAVKVHEVQAQPGAEVEHESAVVGRIGRAMSAATLANKAMERTVRSPLEIEEDVIEKSSASVMKDHDVTRDEIAMLLSDETGLEPRAGRSAGPKLPGEQR